MNKNIEHYLKRIEETFHLHGIAVGPILVDRLRSELEDMANVGKSHVIAHEVKKDA